ncbi:competence type IV pilus major pilin ComGC [Sporosarcina sp. 179-K 3D1 HS]|uniref:competence type IV pilus major pilin ComGC n=1 Tax=Sporosarcina sp. 179-K 3D1 HS TaxID=3232169 RepID=UPI0039A07672
MRNERAFTLIEMMIVLLIISVLILVAIPNVTKHSKSIDEKGCQAYVNMIAMKDNQCYNINSANGLGGSRKSSN